MKQTVNDWIANGCDLADGISLAKSLNLPYHFTQLCKNDADFIPPLRIMICNKSGVTTSPGLTLREQFPFINDKSCPVELKALVTDKFSSFYRYKHLHNDLFDCKSLEECAVTAASLIDAYTDNRSVFAELDYYRSHGKILGRHPVVSHFAQLLSIAEMPLKGLISLKSKKEYNIWRIKNEISKNDKPHLKNLREEKLKLRISELETINRLINER